MLLHDRAGQLVVWAPVGNYHDDMLDSLGQRAFDLAERDGIVGLDLGWRTMVSIGIQTGV
ncbi:hypothetical protein [Paracoccus denitrificans]|jgi:hypothetical protein|nr:hypothetical protein [Paracoccus denitrificans]MBB4630053.1 hypothetical protein [Paracoccus denitrificans]MCU7431376.1 hypothetical protein [Paracoccus denitrificans]UPV97688.1 hypothetical protein M0K93_16665 [Paracoccus denitrificans]WQO35602.1 hypothetical protein U0005_22550 [Paracoccus denitrificans]SDJ81556.1 hypothetical protein SAMN04244581_04870 [Paracoccus denitrificans]